MIGALLLAMVLTQGSPTMAGPTPRSSSSADYFASLLTTIGTECAGSNLAWSDNTAVTTTRASNAYCTDSTGAMTLLSSNAPRVSTLGVLVEESRTNLVLRSEAIDDVAWSGTATTTANTQTAPWGGTVLDTVSSNPAAQVRYQCLTVSSSVGPFITSGYGRATSGTHAATLTVTCSGGFNATSCSCFRGDGTTCTATTSSTQCRGTSTFSTTVDRMVVKSSCSSAVTQICLEIYGGTPSVAGDHVWGGIQMEASSAYATSYIPTTATTATRAADVLSFTPGTSIDAAGCFSGTATWGPVYPSSGHWLKTSGGLALATPTATTLTMDDGTTTATATITSVVGRAVNARSAWGSGISVTEVSGTPGTDVFDGSMGSSTAYLGSNGSTNFLNAHLKSLKLGSTYAGCQ